MNSRSEVLTAVAQPWLLKMMLWIVLSSLWLVGMWAWHCQPIGQIHGRRVVLKEILNSNTRLHLKNNKAVAELKKALLLPPQERLPALLQLELRFGRVFLVGDKIREAIVAAGVSEAVPLIKILAETQVDGLGIVTRGISEALESGAAQPDYKVQVFQLLVDHLKDKRPVLGFPVSDSVPSLLLRLERDRAVRILSHPEYLSPTHPYFLEILSAFDQHEIAIEHSLLRQWTRNLQETVHRRQDAQTYIEVISFLHRYEPSRTEQLLTELIDAQPYAAPHAAEALLRLRDLPHPRFSLSDWREKAGLDALSQAEQTVWLVDYYNYRMSRGGLYALEYDVEDGHIPLMYAALVRVGAARLEEYMALYGPSGPAATEVARNQQIATRGDQWQLARDAIEQRFQDLEDTQFLAVKYALAHADQIRTRSELKQLLGS